MSMVVMIVVPCQGSPFCKAEWASRSSRVKSSTPQSLSSLRRLYEPAHSSQNVARQHVRASAPYNPTGRFCYTLRWGDRDRTSPTIAPLAFSSITNTSFATTLQSKCALGLRSSRSRPSRVAVVRVQVASFASMSRSCRSRSRARPRSSKAGRSRRGQIAYAHAPTGRSRFSWALSQSSR